MFSVIFEVLPNKEKWDNYIDNAKMLRPELEKVEGFVDNIRYKSFTREGWILSLSNWRDEKSVVRWRTRRRHHEAQQKAATKPSQTTTCASARSLPTIKCRQGML
jgi:heme-degrading monooxygenase HmoA